MSSQPLPEPGPEPAPAWNPDSRLVRELPPMPEPQRAMFEPSPSIVVEQRTRTFDPRPALVAAICWIVMAITVGLALPGIARVVGLLIVAGVAAYHLKTYWPQAQRVEVSGGQAVLHGARRSKVIADASRGGKVVRVRVSIPEFPSRETQLWFDGEGRGTASFTEAGWDTDALEAARVALGLQLEVEPNPVPLFELRRRYGRGPW